MLHGPIQKKAMARDDAFQRNVQYTVRIGVPKTGLANPDDPDVQYKDSGFGSAQLFRFNGVKRKQHPGPILKHSKNDETEWSAACQGEDPSR